MRKRLPVRQSRAARVSRPAGAVAIPVIVISALLHRWQYVDTLTLLALLTAGFVLALVAIAAGVAGIVAAWRSGAQGLSDAVPGVLTGLIALSPALAAAAAVAYFPQINDVSTDLKTPPSLQRPAGAPNRLGALKPGLQSRAYPDIVPRRFPIGTNQLFVAAEQIVGARGWTVRRLLPPAMNDDPGELRVEARTLLLGFTDDMIIRILPDPGGSRLDLRSASRFGRHDLGQNARRIRSFLASLDAVLTEAYGTLAPPEADTAPDEPVDDDAPPQVPLPSVKPGSVSG